MCKFFALAAVLTVVRATGTLDWWQSTVFYQIYPRSFMDADGDGVGDLAGITQKLDHLKDAGIGAVWLSPIYKSPMHDFGYDIANFTDIDPTFGTLEDFDKLQARAKELGLKLVLDFVPNHSSTEGEWFLKSENKTDPYTDYFVWKDPKIDSQGNRQPPNNWLSAFGGSAWEWNEKREQYYLHQFVKEQPDLNYSSPYVVEEMKNVLRFWMDRGVDGFRVDALPYLFEDEQWRDEPESGAPGALPNDTNYLQHIYTQNLPGTYDMVEQWREVVEEKKREDGVTRSLMLECYASLEQVMQYYGTKNRPGGHFPFNFLLITDLNSNSTAHDFHRVIHNWMDNMPPGNWPNWVIGNHDQHRVASRYGAELTDGLNMLAQLLPGSAITYNGEEIGMLDTELTYEQTVDPAGLNAGPDRYTLFSRDPERTPFQWDNNTNAGFSTNSTTWLPVNPNYKTLNLELEKAQTISHYKIYKQLVAARKETAVQYGNLETAALSETVFAFTRSLKGYSSFVVVINLGTTEQSVSLKAFQGLPADLTVYTASLGSRRRTGDAVSKSSLVLEPKESLVLTTEA